MEADARGSVDDLTKGGLPAVVGWSGILVEGPVAADVGTVMMQMGSIGDEGLVESVVSVASLLESCSPSSPSPDVVANDITLASVSAPDTCKISLEGQTSLVSPLPGLAAVNTDVGCTVAADAIVTVTDVAEDADEDAVDPVPDDDVLGAAISGNAVD